MNIIIGLQDRRSQIFLFENHFNTIAPPEGWKTGSTLVA